MTHMPVSLVARGHAYHLAWNVTRLVTCPHNMGWAALSFTLSRNLLLSYTLSLCFPPSSHFLISPVTVFISVPHFPALFFFLPKPTPKRRQISLHWAPVSGCDFWMNAVTNISHKQIVPCGHEANLTIKLPTPATLKYNLQMMACVLMQAFLLIFDCVSCNVCFVKKF